MVNGVTVFLKLEEKDGNKVPLSLLAHTAPLLCVYLIDYYLFLASVLFIPISDLFYNLQHGPD